MATNNERFTWAKVGGEWHARGTVGAFRNVSGCFSVESADGRETTVELTDDAAAIPACRCQGDADYCEKCFSPIITRPVRRVGYAEIRRRMSHLKTF